METRSSPNQFKRDLFFNGAPTPADGGMLIAALVTLHPPWEVVGYLSPLTPPHEGLLYKTHSSVTKVLYAPISNGNSPSLIVEIMGTNARTMIII
ncbi:hypothetical protein PIB30_001173 [Stylosanthes scabra]|uniref:Uncharacterized protein n=1 Tax=Stylosanthes scabra TaxID=79078 RepID=A0ABU6V4K6_9FABA|nr:hypothetical protein [Stylosanthes scabra]